MDQELNIFGEGVTKQYLKQISGSRGFRVAMVLTLSLSWLALVNHCELAAATPPKPAKSHSCCETEKTASQVPGKHNDRGVIECCKGATPALVPMGKPALSPNVSLIALAHPVASVASPNVSIPATILELDTGPPFAGSFAEVVLQRSILAHAPPVLA